MQSNPGAALAVQVADSLAVAAHPYCLGDGEQPPGPVLATYFHYAEIARRWRHRLASIHFASIRPDHRLGERLLSRLPRRGIAQVTLLEYERSMADNMAEDVARLLPEARCQIVPKATKRPITSLRRLAPNTPVLVAPRVWNDLPSPWRDDPRVLEVRYTFDADELAAIAHHLRWRRRGARQVARRDTSAVCLRG